MKILFVGDNKSNTGPANVNKCLIENFTEEYYTVSSQHNVFKFFELIYKSLVCDVTVISAITKIGMFALKIGKLFNKKTVYIMHGCAEYEAETNGIGHNSELLIDREKEILKSVGLILPVSKKFSLWVKEQYPDYSDKVKYLFNGVDIPVMGQAFEPKIKNRVIAVGGDRKTKNNTVLSEIVKEMDGKTQLLICGKIHGLLPASEEFISYSDLIPQEQFYRELKRSELFILNSVFEPFSLSVIDALVCGCSVLVSNYSGIVDLLELKDCDIIFDPNDKDEIRKKMEYVLEHPNCERILSSLDFNLVSYQKRINELTEYCKELVKN